MEMLHINKFAAVSLVAFLVLSISWGTVLCHVGNCTQPAQDCSIQQGMVRCTAVAGNG